MATVNRGVASLGYPGIRLDHKVSIPPPPLVVADRLAGQTMTALAESDEILGRLGTIVLARGWPGPGPVPVRRAG